MAKRTDSKLLFPWEYPGEGVLRRARTYARPALAVLALLWMLRALGQVHTERRAIFVTQAAIATTLRAIEAYRADHNGSCPNSLDALVATPDGARAYLRAAPTDGWGRPLRMQCPGRRNPHNADVSSAGPTGSFDDPTQIQ
jgi:general secretion pathway protein G